ncbi:MAG: hypothetical protein ACFE8L_02200 [Candidatus Hodarchaeota archaeon]
MSKVKLRCMKCGKRIKLDFSRAVAICKKCQSKTANKVHIKSEGIL